MPASIPLPREHPDAALCDKWMMCLVVQVQMSGGGLFMASLAGHPTCMRPQLVITSPACHLQAGPSRLTTWG